MTPRTSRADQHRHTAGVCRAESIARRERDPAFAATLERWAANYDRRAVEADAGAQADLFGAIHV